MVLKIENDPLKLYSTSSHIKVTGVASISNFSSSEYFLLFFFFIKASLNFFHYRNKYNWSRDLTRHVLTCWLLACRCSPKQRKIKFSFFFERRRGEKGERLQRRKRRTREPSAEGSDISSGYRRYRLPYRTGVSFECKQEKPRAERKITVLSFFPGTSSSKSTYVEYRLDGLSCRTAGEILIRFRNPFRGGSVEGWRLR